MPKFSSVSFHDYTLQIITMFHFLTGQNIKIHWDGIKKQCNLKCNNYKVLEVFNVSKLFLLKEKFQNKTSESTRDQLHWYTVFGRRRTLKTATLNCYFTNDACGAARQ